MAADEVHHRIEIFLRVVLDLACEPSCCLASIDRAREEVEHHRAQRIVHRRIHLAPREVFARRPVGDLVRGVLPDLTDHDGIGVALLQLGKERLGERRRELVDHVEAPARNPLVHPVVKHAVLACDDEVHVGRVGLVDVRQRVEVPPAVVLVRIVAEVVPRVVRRLLRLVRAERAVPMLAVEIDAVAARMAEYAVEDDADAALLCRRDEGTKVLNIAKHGVDLVVVSRIVVMVALGLKDGVEVDARDSERLQIVELFHDTAQIPAEEIVGDNLLCVGILEIHGVVRPVRADDRALLADDGVTRTREAIRKDLVHHGVLEPVRRTCSLIVDRDLIGLRCLGTEGSHPAQHLRVVPIKIGAAFRRDDEVIPNETSIVRQLKPCGIEFLLVLSVLCFKWDQTLPRLILPEAHEYLMDRLECPNANAEPQTTPRLRRSDDGAKINIL